MFNMAMDIDHKGRIWVGGQKSFGYLRVVPPSPQNQKGDARSEPSEKGDGTKRSDPPGSMEFVDLAERLPDSLRDFNIVWNVHSRKERVYFNAWNIIFVFENDSIRTIRPKTKFYRTHEVDGDLWTEDGEHGIFRITTQKEGADPSGNELSLEKLPKSEALSKKTVMNIQEKVPGLVDGKKKEVLVVTRKNGLYRYRYGAKKKPGEPRITPIKGDGLSRIGKANVHHATVLEPSNNPWKAVLAISTLKSGVILLDRTPTPVKVMDQQAGMSANYTWQTIKGANGSGILWTGTNKGVTRWTPGDPKTYAREGEAFSGVVFDLSTYRGILFAATSQGVYRRAKDKKESNKEWKLVPGTKGQCFDLLNTGKEQRAEGDLLVGKRSLLEIRPNEDGSWKAHPAIDADTYSITSLPSFLKRRWVAFAGREGVVLISRQADGDWKKRIHINHMPEDVSTLEASSDTDGNALTLWAGFSSFGGFRLKVDSSGLARSLHTDSGLSVSYKEILKSKEEGMSILPFTGEKAERKGLPEGSIRFYRFQDRIVAGSDSGMHRPAKSQEGSIRWVPDTALGCRFGKCSRKKAENVQNIFILRQGADRSVWISSQGVFHLIPKKDEQGYRIDSLPFKGMNMGTARSFHPISDRITWIGGNKGVVHYDEKVEKDFKREYPCYVRKVTTRLPDTGKKRMDSVLYQGTYRKPAPKDPLLEWKRAWEQPEAFIPTLPYEMNGLTFHFAAPFYERQEKVVYSYRLKGFDNEWSKWKKEIRKEYTNLPEGSYTFKVKAKNVYGVESEMAEYRFRILPPWYRTWPAYGGYSIAGIGFIWLLVWLNGRRLRIQKERLERTVEERTREIQEKNVSLKEANEAIQAEKEKVESQQQETEKQKREVERAHEALEESHREITDSIDYAQKIQHALLVSEDHRTEALPEHFILLKPQATVSGDFYWIKEQKGYVYFAAVDCTGHGVPGAFMSMLGISQLNEIMAAREAPAPGEVLTELRERVVAELSSGDSEGGAKDGMDAALVKIPLQDPGSPTPNARKIEFAGANNPLYVVKEGIDLSGPLDLTGLGDSDRIKPFKKSSDGFEVKGDKMAVGYEPDAGESFTTLELDIPDGAMLYLFSDGYADQFGGPKDKKFRYGPFKELLARVHSMGPEEQKEELDRVFEEWKADQEQVDDVCVIGIRMPG